MSVCINLVCICGLVIVFVWLTFCFCVLLSVCIRLGRCVNALCASVRKKYFCHGNYCM